MNYKIEDLINLSENDWLDFKDKWHENKADLLLDILCLSNSLSNESTRYLVIGVKEDKNTHEKKISDISSDKNKKNTENIIDFLNQYLYYLPQIEVIVEKICDKEVDIIKILPKFNKLPYMSKKELHIDNRKVIKNVIYGRIGSINTPITEGVSISYIDDLFFLKYDNIDNKTDIFLRDIDNWYIPRGIDNQIYYAKDPNFRIECNINNTRYLNNSEDITNYLDLLRDTYLNENIWKMKQKPIDCSIEESYSLGTAVLLYNNTPLESFDIVEIYLKHIIKGNPILFIPANVVEFDKTNIKNNIQNSKIYKICRLIYKIYNEDMSGNIYGNNDIILDYLNYEYITDVSKYLDNKKELLYEKRKQF